MTGFFRNGGHNPNKNYSLRGNENPEILILAEGDAEAYFLEKWLTNINQNPNRIAVICIKGRNNLPVFIKNLTSDENFPNVAKLGFFFDAELNPATSTISSIEQTLKKYKILKNEHLNPGHQIVNNYEIAIFVSPDNNHPGKIEDLIVNEISASNLSVCINSFSQSVYAVTNVTVNSKTIVQAYMGARIPGLCGAGHGFNKNCLDVMHPAYDSVRTAIGTIL